MHNRDTIYLLLHLAIIYEIAVDFPSMELKDEDMLMSKVDMITSFTASTYARDTSTNTIQNENPHRRKIFSSLYQLFVSYLNFTYHNGAVTLQEVLHTTPWKST